MCCALLVSAEIADGCECDRANVKVRVVSALLWWVCAVPLGVLCSLLVLLRSDEWRAQLMHAKAVSGR